MTKAELLEMVKNYDDDDELIFLHVYKGSWGLIEKYEVSVEKITPAKWVWLDKYGIHHYEPKE